MASAYDRVKTLIQQAADATSSELHKWLLGDPANAAVRYPPAWSHSTQMRVRGSLWGEILFPAVLGGLGQELDTFGICWAHIATNGTGVAPTITAGSHVASATKDEFLNTLTVNFDVDYSGADDYVVLSQLASAPSFAASGARAAGAVTVGYAIPTTGATYVTINGQTVNFLAVGLR